MLKKQTIDIATQNKQKTQNKKTLLIEKSVLINYSELGCQRYASIKVKATGVETMFL